MKIYDLTENQHKTLTQMWNIEGFDELNEWKFKQPTSKRQEIDTLLHMVHYAQVDEEVENDMTLSLATEMLKEIGV